MTRARDVATQGGLVLLNKTDFSTASSVIVDNVFSATYDNYRILLEPTSASNADVDLFIYLRNNGVDTTSVYYTERILQYSTSISGNETATPRIGAVTTSLPQYSQLSMDLKKPFPNTITVWNSQGTYVTNAGVPYQVLISGYYNSPAVFTGIKFFPSAGTFSGSVAIYGYKKN